MDKTIASQIRKTTRAAIVPEWKSTLAQHADTRLQHRVLVSTAAATVTNLNVKLTAGSKGKPLAGGLDPKTAAGPVEFGADQQSERTYVTTSRKGKSYRVTRRTSVQLGPRRRAGKAFYPAANEIIPRVLALYAQTVVRTLSDALEGKSNG
ncbi:hypothetical protein [Glaciihabitans tibetensis]|nr:hypothetical protein [Glaciihabitans tibetensis]